jgi:hypothetical protein
MPAIHEIAIMKDPLLQLDGLLRSWQKKPLNVKDLRVATFAQFSFLNSDGTGGDLVKIVNTACLMREVQSNKCVFRLTFNILDPHFPRSITSCPSNNTIITSWIVYLLTHGWRLLDSRLESWQNIELMKPSKVVISAGIAVGLLYFPLPFFASKKLFEGHHSVLSGGLPDVRWMDSTSKLLSPPFVSCRDCPSFSSCSFCSQSK